MPMSKYVPSTHDYEQGALDALAAIRGQEELREKALREQYAKIAEPSDEDRAHFEGFLEATLGTQHTVTTARAQILAHRRARRRREEGL